jgi:23S rRNA pseudouridine1911/1915/1917 synthase
MKKNSIANTHKIPGDLKALRLDRIVHELFQVPWSKARIWIKRGKIAVNGKVVVDLDTIPIPGQEVTYTEDARLRDKNAFDPRNLVYLDTHILVAYKPSGILTVPYQKGDKGSFDQQLRSYLARKIPKGSKKKKGALPALMIVHRIDKGTSGLLVFARTWTAKEGLASQFRDHSVTRRYLALVHGKATSKKIESHLRADRGDGIRGSSETSPHAKIRKSGTGKIAITHVDQLESLHDASLVACKLKTGRTNQVRIHMSEDGHPLLGETTYMRGFKGKRIRAERLMLHAAELGFVHPVSGEELYFEQTLPADFEAMLARLRKKD